MERVIGVVVAVIAVGAVALVLACNRVASVADEREEAMFRKGTDANSMQENT